MNMIPSNLTIDPSQITGSASENQNHTPEAIWTIRKITQWSAQYLKEKGSPSAALDAEILLAEVLGCKRIDLYIQRDKPLSHSERGVLKELVYRRAMGEPIAYLIGKKNFWRSEFIVEPAVLVPRSDSELLVEVAIEFLRDKFAIQAGRKLRVLDVGTGSGCIGISIAQEFPEVDIIGWDISAPALSVAEKNIQKHNIQNFSLMKVNAADPFSWCSTLSFDLIVSNPPYVAKTDQGMLDVSVVKFEPHLALFAGRDGLDFYNCFSEHAFKSLTPSGKILVEVGLGQAEKVSDRFTQEGWKHISIHQDLSGIDRVVSADRID